ncbi:MAG: hypothetical protein WCO57_14160 [Verrucomicrobiota bacterium]
MPAPDFADGFKRLAALGMPALDARATWIKHPGADADYELRALIKSVKGNAWLIPSPDGKTNVVPLGGVEPVTADSGDEKPAAKPGPPQDLTKDVEAVTAAIDKLVAKLDPDEFSYRSRDSGLGKFLLFATQLYQNGHPELANPLALAVFKLYPTREAAVDAAVDLLADPLYQQATRTFFTSGDWATYHQALVALSKRFPRGWSNRDAVAVMLPQLAKQTAGAKAPAIALPDLAIDPRALAIVRELTEKAAAQAKPSNPRGIPSAMRRRMQIRVDSDGDYFSPTPLWLINDTPDAAKNPAPLARLAALKMAALPVLAALTADPFLTQLPNPRSSSGYHSSHESGEEQVLRQYASLDRPATRGELATQLLIATLPDPQNELDNTDSEALREIALTFWKEHKSATREELAAVFLRDGSSSQAEQAASILATSSEPKAHQAFEDHVLAADPAIALYRHVQTYLRTRKAAAKPFFEAYAKLVRSQTPASATDTDSSYDRSWEVKQAGGPDKILKQLEALIGGQSPRALAVEIAKGKPADAAAAIKTLTSLLADATPTKHLHALLEGANAATDATIRARFLEATFQIRAGNDEEGGAEEPPPATPPVERKVSEPEAIVWRKLIADTSELSKEFSRYMPDSNSTGTTVANLAALAFEYSISPGTARSLYQAAPILNKSISTIVMERAGARLSDKLLPPLPDAKKIPAARLAEIVAAAGAKPAAQIHPYLTSLTPDERAAWLTWLNEPGDLAIPDAVKALQFTLIARLPVSYFDLPDVKEAGNFNLGFRITADSLTQHIAALAPEIDQHSRAFIIISPANFGPGLQITANLIPLPAQQASSNPNQDDPEGSARPSANSSRAFAHCIKTLDANESASAIAVVGLQSEQARGQTIWLIQNGKATLQQADAKDKDENAQNPFADALKGLLESKEPQHCRFYIQLLSRADAAKFKAATEDPSTPTEEQD